MSQHSQRVQRGPSRWTVAANAAVTALSTAGTAYTLLAPGLAVKDVVGFLLGLCLTVVMSVALLGLVAERALAAARIEREAIDQAFRQARMEQVRREREERELMVRQAGLTEPDTSGPIPMTPPMYADDRWDPSLTEPMRVVDDAVTGYPNEEVDPDGYPRSAMGSVAMPLPPREHGAQS